MLRYADKDRASVKFQVTFLKAGIADGDVASQRVIELKVFHGAIAETVGPIYISGDKHIRFKKADESGNADAVSDVGLSLRGRTTYELRAVINKFSANCHSQTSNLKYNRIILT